MKTEITEKSPITGNDCVIVEVIDGKTSKICMESGYMTNSDFNFANTDKLAKYEESMPELMIDTKLKDEDISQFWYLTSVQFRTGMIYPQPSEVDVNKYEWAFTPIIELSEEEKLNYPVPGKDGEYYNTRLATEITETYKSDQFKAVCKRAGAVIESE
jgi:hypothetical protein